MLTYRVDGDARGAAVLLLNGGLMSIASWDDIAGTLARERRVIRCDFRGQLLTPELPPPDLAAHVGDVIALLDHLGLDRVHAVGTSFGGEVALLLAARHHERVRTVVAATVVDRPPASMRAAGERLIALCESAATTGDGGPFFAAMSELVYSPAYRARHEADLKARFATLASLPAAWFEGGVRLLQAVDRMDLSGELERIACPTLVIAAECDAMMPMERTRALAGAIAGAELTVAEGSGHALVVEKKELFGELVNGFLALLPPEGGSVLRSA